MPTMPLVLLLSRLYSSFSSVGKTLERYLSFRFSNRLLVGCCWASRQDCCRDIALQLVCLLHTSSFALSSWRSTAAELGLDFSGPTPNQSFERTRSAAASGSAGQHSWRAAQLRIR